jgi:hypothetical protein
MYYVLDQFLSTGSQTEASHLPGKPPLPCSSPREQIYKATAALSSGLGYRRVVWLLVYLAGFLVPATAWGQAGYYLRPGLSVGEKYDDNIFRSVSGRKDDFISRIGAGVEAGYDSDPLTLLGHYRMASEIYAKHPELSNAFSLQDAGVNFTYLPTRLWTLGFSGGYVDTNQPETINVATGILGARTRARNYNFSPSLFHLYDPFTTLSAIYTFNRTEEKGGASTDSHTARFVDDWRLNARDTLHLGYIFREFNSSGNSNGSNGSETANIPTIGWTRLLSQLTTFTLNIGPRFSSTGTVTPEVLATIRRELKDGEVSFTYVRTQYTVVGEGGPVTTDGVLLSWDRQLANRLLVTVTPAFYNNSGSDLSRKVYALDLEAVYQINKWLGFRGSYQFTFEEGQLFRTGPSTHGERYRNVVLLELVAFYPMRLY